MSEDQDKNDDFFLKLSRKTLILRRNLLSVSAPVLMVLLLDLEIDFSNFLGIEIEGLTKEKAYGAALILLLYFTLHFTWGVWNESQELFLKSIEWSKNLDGAISKKNAPHKKGSLKILYDQTYNMLREPKLHGNAKNALSKLEPLIKRAEKSWRGQLVFFEIGLPIAMGILAMLWLGALIVAQRIAPA